MYVITGKDDSDIASRAEFAIGRFQVPWLERGIHVMICMHSYVISVFHPWANLLWYLANIAFSQVDIPYSQLFWWALKLANWSKNVIGKF